MGVLRCIAWCTFNSLFFYGLSYEIKSFCNGCSSHSCGAETNNLQQPAYISCYLGNTLGMMIIGKR